VRGLIVGDPGCDAIVGKIKSINTAMYSNCGTRKNDRILAVPRGAWHGREFAEGKLSPAADALWERCINF
jgi:hypothetical protein